MKLLRTLLIGSDENIEQRNMIWNMLGSFLYAFASMVLTIAVIQVVGEDQGGDFTFAFTTFGQHMFMVAYFGIRPFHITDTRQKYTFGEYLRLRFITCGAALLFGLLYAAAHGGTYTREKAMTVFLMVCYKVIDGFADAYEAEFQRDGRLYLTGKSNTFRTLLSVFCFMGSLVTTKDLVFSCVVAVAAQAAGVLLFDFSVIGHISGVDWKVRKHKTWWLFRDNILLFLSVIIDFYVFSASKYAVDANMASRDMSVFGAIFMPTSFINLVAGFVIALRTSMSRVISVLFVSTDTPKPNSSISSNAPRVTRRVRSNGLYVSDMAPTPTMPRTRRLRSSRRRMANASNLTLTWLKSSMR